MKNLPILTSVHVWNGTDYLHALRGEDPEVYTMMEETTVLGEPSIFWECDPTGHFIVFRKDITIFIDLCNAYIAQLERTSGYGDPCRSCGVEPADSHGYCRDCF